MSYKLYLQDHWLVHLVSGDVQVHESVVWDGSLSVVPNRLHEPC